MSFKAEQKTISKLLNDCIYYIPINQRKYVWEEENWADLLYDVKLSADGGTPHFLGSIVLQKDKDELGLETFLIIDGQQRMITLTVLLLAIMKKMKEENLENDFNGVLKYIESVDNKNARHMILNLENYRIIFKILEMMKKYDSKELRRLSTVAFLKQCGIQDDWEKRISNSFRFFYEQLDDSSINTGKLLGIRDAVLNTNYVHIQADSEEDSYTIFEILNARGLELENSELLKNYIMRHMTSSSEKEDVKRVWGKIETLLGDNLKNYIKHYAPHVYRTTSDEDRKEPYKLIKSNCRGPKVKSLVEDIELKAKYYAKIVSPNIFDGTDDECSVVEKKVYGFFKKHRFEQFRPVLLSLIHNKEIEKISLELYEQSILFIYKFVICFNLIGKGSSNKLRDAIYTYAPKLERDCTKESIEEFFENLKKRTPNEAWFANVFKNLGWSHKWESFKDDKAKKNVQLVLGLIEEHWGGVEADFTIEHILPDSSSEENALIGNLLPLEENLNRRCKDKDWKDKLEIYEKSRFESTRKFAEIHKQKDNFDMNDRMNRMSKMFYNEILSIN